MNKIKNSNIWFFNIWIFLYKNFFFVDNKKYNQVERKDKNGRFKSNWNTYSAQAVDPQIKQIFTKSAQDALNTKQKLMSFLNN